MPVDLKALSAKLINLMLDTVFVVDEESRIIFVSDACESLLGYRADELVGTLITNYMHPEDLEITQGSIDRVMSGIAITNFQNRYIHKDGSVVHIRWSARWSQEDRVRIGVARDVTALTVAEEELRYLAHHDPLTGLTNRSLFYDRLKLGLRMAHRHRTGVALLFLDLDNFKEINDAHGHAVGDNVLCSVARRLKGCVRAADTIARMGGDEFIVLLTDIQSPEAISMKVEQILAAVAEPLPAELASISPSCSVGVARYPADGVDAESLLNHADAEMYRMKRRRLVADRIRIS